MDPDRHLPNPIRNPPRNQPQLMSSPDAQPRAAPPTASQYQQPSLPSIRQLHPYLPPSGMPQPHGPASGLPAYPYPSSSPYAGPSSSDPHFAPPAPSAAYHRSEPLESEGEAETEHQGPPKKKRRRQALSCNEVTMSVSGGKSNVTGRNRVGRAQDGVTSPSVSGAL
ncbi:hypothetical protein ID866_4995 [Astraeus odoratus]|nr:hypothetical protein ID866_4995 [Astraeus odoratus]